MAGNKWICSLFALAGLCAPVLAQTPLPYMAFLNAPAPISLPNLGEYGAPTLVQAPVAAEPVPDAAAWALNNQMPAYSTTAAPAYDRFKGNQNFQNFIGFISNPLQSIDPRAVTEFFPIFASYHTSSVPALPSADMQLYGAGIYLALSERLSVGLNQGGYAQAYFSRNQPGLFPNLQGVIQNRRNFSGLREGWLNFGGFAQYTLIEDVARQFLLTAGMRWSAPSGASQLFQGNPPWKLAPYLTMGKEIGLFHILANVGYNFDAGSTKSTLDNFYVNLHFDRQCFGWLYPLVEINSSFPTSTVNVGLPTRDGFIDLGNFSSTGSIVMVAAGANAVIVKNKLEFGAVYTTSVASERNFNVEGLIVRMTLRY